MNLQSIGVTLFYQNILFTVYIRYILISESFLNNVIWIVKYFPDNLPYAEKKT